MQLKPNGCDWARMETYGIEAYQRHVICFIVCMFCLDFPGLYFGAYWIFSTFEWRATIFCIFQSHNTCRSALTFLPCLAPSHIRMIWFWYSGPWRVQVVTLVHRGEAWAGYPHMQASVRCIKRNSWQLTVRVCDQPPYRRNRLYTVSQKSSHLLTVCNFVKS